MMSKPFFTEEEIISAINALSYVCHNDNKQWWLDSNGKEIQRNKGELIALMHSELSESLEGVRKDKMDDKLPHRKMEEVELADCLIRIFDYAGAFGLDLGMALIEKRKYNFQREDHKIENRMLEGGKKF